MYQVTSYATEHDEKGERMPKTEATLDVKTYWDNLDVDHDN